MHASSFESSLRGLIGRVGCRVCQTHEWHRRAGAGMLFAGDHQSIASIAAQNMGRCCTSLTFATHEMKMLTIIHLDLSNRNSDVNSCLVCCTKKQWGTILQLVTALTLQ